MWPAASSLAFPVGIMDQITTVVNRGSKQISDTNIQVTFYVLLCRGLSFPLWPFLHFFFLHRLSFHCVVLMRTHIMEMILELSSQIFLEKKKKKSRTKTGDRLGVAKGWEWRKGLTTAGNKGIMEHSLLDCSDGWVFHTFSRATGLYKSASKFLWKMEWKNKLSLEQNGFEILWWICFNMWFFSRTFWRSLAWMYFKIPLQQGPAQ